MSDPVRIGKIKYVFDETGDMRLVLGDPEEMPDYDCPFCDEAMYHEVKWNIGDFMMDRYRCENCKGSATKQTLASAPMAESKQDEPS